MLWSQPYLKTEPRTFYIQSRWPTMELHPFPSEIWQRRLFVMTLNIYTLQSYYNPIRIVSSGLFLSTQKSTLAIYAKMQTNWNCLSKFNCSACSFHLQSLYRPPHGHSFPKGMVQFTCDISSSAMLSHTSKWQHASASGLSLNYCCCYSLC